MQGILYAERKKQVENLEKAEKIRKQKEEKKQKKIEHDKKGEVDVANTNDEINLTLECDNNDWKKEFNFALLRTKGMKEF